MTKLIKSKDNWSPEEKGGKCSGGAALLTFLLPAALVIAILFLVAYNQGGIETAVANLTNLLPVGFAFSAGMVASVNPCGVVMLTSFAFQRLGDAKEKSTARQVLESIGHTATITASFLLIFLGVGAIIASGSQVVLDYFPLAGFLVGAGMTLLGLWLMIRRKTLSLNINLDAGESGRSGILADFLFGISYAIASLSCTLPIFLVVAGNTLSAGFSAGALWQFGAYALGMGTAVLVVVLGSVLFKRGMARWLRKITPYVHRLSSLFLTAAGIYIMIYWISQGNLF